MLERYRQMDLQTASPITLVVRLYEGAIRNAMQARTHIEEGRIAERAKSVSKALAIVSELQATLDPEQGGDLVARLDSLYGFVSDRLIDANLSASVASLDEAIEVLTTLLEGWSSVARGGATAGPPAP